jgi:hypothetical protein
MALSEQKERPLSIREITALCGGAALDASAMIIVAADRTKKTNDFARFFMAELTKGEEAIEAALPLVDENMATRILRRAARNLAAKQLALLRTT